jgi:hypothetical protein
MGVVEMSLPSVASATISQLHAYLGSGFAGPLKLTLSALAEQGLPCERYVIG